MEINSIDLEYMSKSGFNSSAADGMCHVKTLPYLSVVQAVVGNYDIALANNEMYNTGEKGFFIAPADIRQTIVHHVDKNSKNMICRWVFLKIKINDLYFLDELYDFPVILPTQYQKSLDSIFNRLFKTDTVFDEYVCYYEIVKILSLVAQEKPSKTLFDLGNVFQYIKDNYSAKITVKDLAQKAAVSDSHFYSVFKKATGLSPIAYLNNYRLSIAADNLLKSDRTITEIAGSVGIFDPIYFNKMFRKAYQMSPSKYREVYKIDRGNFTFSFFCICDKV